MYLTSVSINNIYPFSPPSITNPFIKIFVFSSNGLDKDMPKLDYFSSDRWFQQLLKLPEYRRSSLISLPRS